MTPLVLLLALVAILAIWATALYGSTHSCIADPIGRPMNLTEGRWADLFASHPPVQARIAALRAMTL